MEVIVKMSIFTKLHYLGIHKIFILYLIKGTTILFTT
jgi:hypothetical protein